MGWLDNLQEELDGNKPGPSGLCNPKTYSETCMDDSQPGPSGLCNPRRGPDESTMVEKFEIEEGPPKAVSQNAQPKDGNVKKPKKKPLGPVELFTERVTIAGLREAFEEQIAIIRYMFQLTIVGFLIIIIFQTVKIAYQYMNQSTTLDIFEINNIAAPYPNISVCYPTFYNGTLIGDMLPDILQNDKKAQAVSDKNSFTKDDFFNFLQRFLRIEVTSNYLQTLEYWLSAKLFDDVDSIFRQQKHSIWEAAMIPTCNSVLSNCALDGQPFDCCRIARPATLVMSPCHEMAISKFSVDSYNGRSENNILQMHLRTDWQYSVFDSDSSANDGYHIYIDTVPIPVKLPVSIPSGMDALIVLGEPKKLTELKDCLPAKKIPQLKHFQYYDSQGVQCMWEYLVDFHMRYIGCQVHGGPYIPINQSCTFPQYVLATIAQNTISSAEDVRSILGVGIDEKRFQAFIDNALLERRRMAEVMGRHKSSCKPLCSRWEYPVASVSYSEIQYQDQEKKAKNANITWSRVRIIFPYTTSISHTEKPTLSAWYLALCDIGGMMGVYLGFSAITFIQVACYGIYLTIEKRYEIRAKLVYDAYAAYDLTKRIVQTIRAFRRRLRQR